MKILYLGLEVPFELSNADVTHYPIIRIEPRPKEHQDIINTFVELEKSTHLIFTSKSAVRIFFDYANFFDYSLTELHQKTFISVGKKTEGLLQKFGIEHVLTAKEETAEGVIELIAKLNNKEDYFLWPHSSLSRSLISNWFTLQGIKLHECIFYDTVMYNPGNNLDIEQFDEIIFTSSSTVDAYIQIFGKLPMDKKLTCIGPITENHLKSKYKLD